MWVANQLSQSYRKKAIAGILIASAGVIGMDRAVSAFQAEDRNLSISYECSADDGRTARYSLDETNQVTMAFQEEDAETIDVVTNEMDIPSEDGIKLVNLWCQTTMDVPALMELRTSSEQQALEQQIRERNETPREQLPSLWDSNRLSR